MRLLSLVHGCESDPSSQYALIPLDAPFAQRTLRWRELAQQHRAADPAFYRLTFLLSIADWLTLTPQRQTESPAADAASNMDEVLRSLLSHIPDEELTRGAVVPLPEGATSSEEVHLLPPRPQPS